MPIRSRQLRSRACVAAVIIAAHATGAGPARAQPRPPPSSSAQPSPAPPTPPGSARGDTGSLKQFEQGVEFAPRDPAYRVSFSLEDADLPELVRVIGELTGRRFIFGGKVRNIKATIFAPQKVTVAEAYQAFLSILQTNGLTVLPRGRFYEIVDSQGVNNLETPVYGPGQASTREDRFVTRMHRLQHASADEVAALLGHFKTKEADITVYGPGNLMIVTDTGPNIERMMQIVDDVDVGGSGDQIWIEPIHYTSSADLKKQLDELFDSKGGGAPASGGKPGAAPAAHAAIGAGEIHVAKIISDDRSNSLVIIATERAYLQLLELIKRLDVPHSGEGEIHVLPLQHADAVELTKTLQEIITGASQAAQPAGGASRGGGATTPPAGVFEAGIKVSADKATNAVVITSSLRDYAALRAVIDKLDQPRRQVFIEAVVMDLTITRQNQLGMSFHAGDLLDTPIDKTSGQTTVIGGLNPFATIGLPNPTDPTLQALALDVRGPGITGTENVLGTGLSIPAFGVLMTALAGTNDADILSTPHVLATDNTPAEIQVVQNIATQVNAGGFPGLPGLPGGIPGAPGANPLGALGGLGMMGGFGFGATAPRAEVGTKIKMVPHLNDSNEVRLEVQEEISDVTGDQPQGALGVIPFARRVANTTLVVKDQQTVVIGGLVRNRVARTTTKIPLLGDIPVLGALFRQSSDKMEKSNLILVLTPHIIRDQSDLRTIFERKMQERQEFLDHYFVFTDQQDYEPPKDYSRTFGVLEDIRRSYVEIEEQKQLEALKRRPEARTHEPGEPVAVPERHAGNAPHAAPAAPAPAVAVPQPPAALDVATPPRQVERPQ